MAADRATFGSSGGFQALVLVAAGATLAGLWWGNVIRPGAWRNRPMRPTGRLESPMWLVVGLGIYVLAALLGGITVAMAGAAAGNSGAASGGGGGLLAGWLGPADGLKARGLAMLVGTLGAGLVGVAVLAWINPGRGDGEQREPGGVRGVMGSWRAWLAGGAGFVVAAPVLMGVSVAGVLVVTWLRGRAPDPIAHGALREIVFSPDPWKWALAAAAVLGAPLVEEVVYRGCVQTAAVKALGGRWRGIVLTSVLFALVHMGGQASVPAHALVTLGVLGLALGVVYERSGGLAAPVAMHALFNAANVATAVWTGGAS